jgi:hypothetical protein
MSRFLPTGCWLKRAKNRKRRIIPMNPSPNKRDEYVLDNIMSFNRFSDIVHTEEKGFEIIVRPKDAPTVLMMESFW